MEYVDVLIKRINKRYKSLEEAFLLEKEVLKFLNSEQTPLEQKNKIKNKAYLEALAIASDGYKKQNKLEHYSAQKD